MSIRHAPFDDSYTRSRQRGTVNQSTFTTDFDAYRQGVELTLPKHYTQGMVKIRSAYSETEGDHSATQFVYGQTQTVLLDELYHRDILPTYPKDHASQNTSLVPVVVDKGVDLDVSTTNFDGVIEPLEIRDVVARKELANRYDRKLWATLGEGNVLDRQGSDVHVTIVKDSDAHFGSFPIVDTTDNFGNLKVMPASISTDNRKRGPFNENYRKKGAVTSSSMGSDMIAGIEAMGPGTENMIPTGYTQLGATGTVY